MLAAEHHSHWFEGQIKDVYEIDFEARLGPNDGDTRVVTVLNRIIEWQHYGICMESDHDTQRLLSSSRYH